MGRGTEEKKRAKENQAQFIFYPKQNDIPFVQK